MIIQLNKSLNLILKIWMFIIYTASVTISLSHSFVCDIDCIILFLIDIFRLTKKNIVQKNVLFLNNFQILQRDSICIFKCCKLLLIYLLINLSDNKVI